MAENDHKVLKMIIAVIIAFIAWMFVVYNFDPNITVTYNNVPIQYAGEDTLANNGYGVISTGKDEISVTLQQKRVDTSTITADSITVVADVSEAVDGENGITLDISSPNGTTVLESDTRILLVKVEKTGSKDVDVFVEYSDDEDGNAEPDVSNITSDKVRVVGAASNIDKIEKAAAYISVDDTAPGKRTFTRRLAAVDSEGNIVPHIVLYPSEVNFTASAAITRTVNVNIIAVDNSGDNYVRTYKGPKSVTVKGPADIIDSISEVQTTEIDLSNIYEDREFEIEYDLPEGVSLANGESPGIIAVTVTLEEKEETEDNEDADSSANTSD